MKAPIRVVVTAKDIAAGKRAQTRCCPVALALKRRKFRGVFVGYDKLKLDGRWFDLPAHVAAWISDFDARSGASRPFGFTLTRREFGK